MIIVTTISNAACTFTFSMCFRHLAMLCVLQPERELDGGTSGGPCTISSSHNFEALGSKSLSTIGAPNSQNPTVLPGRPATTQKFRSYNCWLCSYYVCVSNSSMWHLFLWVLKTCCGQMEFSKSARTW